MYFIHKPIIKFRAKGIITIKYIMIIYSYIYKNDQQITKWVYLSSIICYFINIHLKAKHKVLSILV